MSDLPKQPSHPRAPDRLLAYFVALAEVHPNAIPLPLILTVGGLVLYGTLSDTVTYTDALSEAFGRTITDPAVAQNWQQAFREASTITRGHLEQFDTDQSITVPGDTQLHLRDVSFLEGDAWHELRWWRGRLDSIDGWSLNL